MSESSTPTPPSLTHFDADARAATLTVPTLTIGGLRYRGRILSAAEWLPWYERYLELTKESATDMRAIRARLVLYREYLAVVFPRHTLKFWAPDPARLLERQPGNQLAEAFTHFFFLQLSAITGPDEQAPTERLAADPMPSPSPEPGNTSSGKTPEASADAPPSTSAG